MASIRDEIKEAYKAMKKPFSKEMLRRCRAYIRKTPNGLSPKHRPYAGDKQSHRPGRALSDTAAIGSALRLGKCRSKATGPMKSAHSRHLHPMVQC
jgi:hypothetical protein